MSSNLIARSIFPPNINDLLKQQLCPFGKYKQNTARTGPKIRPLGSASVHGNLVMSAVQREQFAPLPVRAMADARLSRHDLAVLAVIAYHDRSGCNGIGCMVDCRKLAAEAGVQASHLGRHIKRLQELDYIEVAKSETDRRRRSFHVIYKPSTETVATDDDNRTADVDEKGDTVSPSEDVVATDGEYSGRIVAIENTQGVENKNKAHTKKSCKTEIINQAKPLGANSEKEGTGVPPFARQGEPYRRAVPRQCELRALSDVNQKRNQAEARLGNAFVQSGMMEELEDILMARTGLPLAKTKEYRKAIECEASRRGNGLKYLAKIVDGGT